ncbi:MAG: glycoside hydrolase family 25 protein [Wolbachia sp.]
MKFAFAKATEGGTYQDPKFEENFKGIKENNVQAGAYHVFRMTSTPDEQITNITNTLTKASFDSNKDKLAISATTGICEGERTRKCDNPTNHTNTERAENLHSLLTKLDKNGYSPIVHASPKTWNSYYTQKDHDFSKYPLWVADWRDRSEPELPKDWKDAGKDYTYWNYTSQGRVDGIEGQVPLDQTNQDVWIS